MKLKQPICKKQEKIGRIAAGKTKKACKQRVNDEYVFHKKRLSAAWQFMNRCQRDFAVSSDFYHAHKSESQIKDKTAYNRFDLKANKVLKKAFDMLQKTTDMLAKAQSNF